MKKNAILFLIAILSAFMLAGCQNNSTTPAASQEGAVASHTPSAAPATPSVEKTEPEPVKYTASDILGGELNPLYDLQLPKSFTLESVFIHTPGWGIIGDAMQYHMYLVAPKDNETIIALASLLGVTSKNVIKGYIETFQKEGRIMIDGSEIQSGTDCICEIKTSPKDNGWQIQLVSIIDEKNKEKYSKFIEDNYNMNVFATVSKSLALMPVPDNFKINVCYVDVDDMMKTEFEVAYTVDNRPAIMDSLLTGGGYDRYDSANKKIGIDFGDIHGDVWFADNRNHINIYQSCKGIPDIPLGDYVFKPVITLDTYGFRFDAQKGISLYENRGEQYSKLGFHSPAWGEMDEKWGFEFLYSFKEGRVVVWYRPEENRYDVRIEKGSDAAAYAYNIEKNVYENMYPDKETVHKYLNDLYKDSKTDDLHARVFEILEQYSLDISGKEFAELVSLPPVVDGSFEPMPALPALPKAGASRTTLSTLGFQFKEYGSWGCYDAENRVSVDIYQDAWSAQTEEWNRNVIWYYQVINGHLLAIAIYPDKARCSAQIYEKEEPTDEGMQSYFAYDSKSKVVLEKNTMGTNMQTEEFFAKMLGISNTGTIYTDVIELFGKYTKDHFSLSPEELYGLDTD